MLSIRDILLILFKRKAVIIGFFLALCLVSFTILKVVPPTYTATSKILIKIGREDVYTPSVTTDAFVSPLISSAREEQLNSEVQIITSEALISKLVDKMGPEGIYPGMLKVHPFYTPKGVVQRVMWMYKYFESIFVPLSAHLTPEQKALKRFSRKDLKVLGTGNSNVIAISVSGKIPDLVAQVNNELVDLYLTERSLIHDDSEGAIFQTQMEDIEARLQEAQAERRIQDVEVLKKSRKYYLEKIEEHKINAALKQAQIGNVTIISRALPPTSPSSPKFWMVLLAMLGVGIVGGIGLAFLVELIDDTIETDSDVKKHLGLQVIGKISNGELPVKAA